MKINFDEIIDRRNTNSFKWDGIKQYYGKENIIPMWVADMDFKCAPEILEALQDRIKHGVLGYTCRNENYYDAVMNWFQVRHGWKIKKKSLTFAPPGVIFAINLLIQILSDKGDKIIIQTPNYGPLIDVINLNDRVASLNPLKINNDKYEIDYAGLERIIDEKTRLLILSNPHNPTGRVWTYNELEGIGDICLKNNIFIISDDIHCDIVYKPHKYVPISSISPEIAQNSVICTSISKTFNLGGLQLATIIIENEEIRERFNIELYKYQTRLDNVFGQIALETAYNKCGYWVDEVLSYIRGNLDALKDFIGKSLSEIKLYEPEGTYFAWIDFSGLGLKYKLNDFMINHANVAFSHGVEFSQDCDQFVRVNLACRRELLLQAFRNIHNALKNARIIP